MKRATIGAKPMKQKIAIAKSAAAEFHYSYVRLDGNDATATAFVATNYGKSLWLSGERREAHSVWNEALESGITTPLLISAKLEALIEENDSESAIATLTAWTKNNTPTAEIHYWAAMAYCRAGNYPVAAEHVSLAIGAGFPAGHLSRQIKNRECKTTRQPEIAN